MQGGQKKTTHTPAPAIRPVTTTHAIAYTHPHSKNCPPIHKSGPKTGSIRHFVFAPEKPMCGPHERPALDASRFEKQAPCRVPLRGKRVYIEASTWLAAQPFR